MLMALILAAAEPTPWPRTWANDYCVYRAVTGLTHEEAVNAASETAGGSPTTEAWEYTKTNSWCNK